jgi:hypothetical protein
MSKKVTISRRPPKPTADADAWVEKRQTEEEEGTDRLTIDIPMSLHARFKAGCALEKKSMKRVIIEFLQNRYPAKS